MLFQYRDTQDQLDQLQNPVQHLVSTGQQPLSSICVSDHSSSTEHHEIQQAPQASKKQ